MLLSINHSLLFVHIQKTAGTSLTRFLKQEICDLEAFLRPHDPLRFAQEKMGAEFERYTKVGFVRNPFDRLVSWYSMITESGRLLSDYEMQKNPGYNKIWQTVLSQSSTFEEFIFNCSDATDRSGWKPFLYNQTDYLKTADGNIGADFIGRFENLSRDVERLCKIKGLTLVSLPHINKSSHTDYRKYYSEEMRTIIEERFAEDLEYFGYEF
ncbi:sulfotransferase family 2 domain-containing protein [Alteromonas flava]|uniref:sulfotransferase family 2 domain-containing protein n=1 Tax=Alteromonas flava TaxID=2048003 RepID=UPI000C290FDB|nr:sulfotransferase family 2 domain-containing protein [Alteromonas flava]